MKTRVAKRCLVVILVLVGIVTIHKEFFTLNLKRIRASMKATKDSEPAVSTHRNIDPFSVKKPFEDSEREELDRKPFEPVDFNPTEESEPEELDRKPVEPVDLNPTEESEPEELDRKPVESVDFNPTEDSEPELERKSVEPIDFNSTEESESEELDRKPVEPVDFNPTEDTDDIDGTKRKTRPPPTKKTHEPTESFETMVDNKRKSSHPKTDESVEFEVTEDREPKAHTRRKDRPITVEETIEPGNIKPTERPKHNVNTERTTPRIPAQKPLEPINFEPPERPEAMLNTARKITAYSKTVMVAVVNDAYLPLAYSWLCNTKVMGIHKYVLFIAADDETAKSLKRDWPEVSVASMNVSQLKGARKFGDAGYFRINVKRHQYIYELLKEGVELLHFEVDSVWLRNPLPYLQRHEGYDLLPSKASGNMNYCSGFVYVFNTKRTKLIWRLLAQKMEEVAHRIANVEDGTRVERENDQAYYSEIIRSRVPGLKIKVLPLDLFPDGRWYRVTEEERKNVTNPFFIHNNWIVGNDNKIKRAKQWNHWFLDDDMKCNMDLVRKVVKKT